MSHRYAALFLGLLVACAAPRAPATQQPNRELAPRAPATPGPDDDLAPRIARIEQGLLPAVQVAGEDLRHGLADRMHELKIPALSIAVFADYQLLWARAYGLADVDTGVRVDDTTLFQAGSISKSVHALAVLMAAADGTLALDRPVNEQLTGWKLPDNDLTRATPVTLRHLLSHTAGTTVHGFPGYAVGEPVPDIIQILDGVQPANTPAIRVDLAPGTRFRYSGGGTTISQLVLTERAQQPYPELLAARVLTPLGMTHSSYEQPLPPARLDRAAAGHTSDGRSIAGKRHTYPEMAAAGLWTTPTDLARFFIEVELARAGRSQRISQAVAQLMTTRVIDIPGSSDAIGLGVFLSDRNGARFFGHGGADDGFQADALASLDGGYGVIVMANSDNGFRIFEEIERAVFAEYAWPGADPPIVRVTLTPAEQARFVGVYLDGRLPFTIAEIDDKLTMRAPFGESTELVPIAADTVVARDSGLRLQREASGALAATYPRSSPRQLARLAETVRHPLIVLETDRYIAAVATWREQARADPAAAREDEAFANRFAYGILREQPASGVKLFELIAAVFPGSSNAHDSLGEAYMLTGNTAGAIAEYRRAIATLNADPRIPAARRPIHRARAEAQLAKLRAATKPSP